MRERWRAERDRSTPDLLDLKQGAGALLDIEFILQTLVLLQSHDKSELLASGNSAELIAIAKRCGTLDAASADRLAAAHSGLLKRALDCTLDMRSRLVPRSDALQSLTAGVLDVATSIGLDFAASVAR